MDEPRRLTPADLEAWEARARAHMPALRNFQLVVAIEVLIHFLGTDWYVRNMTRTDPFLTTPGSGRTGFMGDPFGEYRVMVLAMRLYELQEAEGFSEALHRLRRASLRGAYAEVLAVALLGRSQRTVRFIRANTGDGRNYDAEVDRAGQTIAVEVKAKEEQAGHSAFEPRSVENSLRKASRQLPEPGPGIICLHVPGSWGTDPIVWANLLATTTSWLHTGRRVNAVIFMYEARQQLPDGRGLVVTGFDFAVHADPKTHVPGVRDLITGFKSGPQDDKRPRSP